MEHTAAGLRDLVSLLGKHGVGEVAIERPDGPVIDALLEAGLTVVVISPNQVKNLRGRYGSAGNKDDRFDAFVLADTLRTDRPRLRRLEPDSPATVALRAHLPGPQGPGRPPGRGRQPAARAPAQRLSRRRRSVRRHRLRISLAFLTRFTTRTKPTGSRPSDWRTGWPPRLLRPHQPRAVLHARLTAAPRGLDRRRRRRPAPTSPGPCSPSWRTLVEQIKTLSDPDQRPARPRTPTQHIFTSLPRSGTVRAARLLAEIGDCRARFPTPESLACLAGVAPSTRQSGKLRAVGFRWACDKQLRDAVTDFAGDSRHANPWAADLYRRARARGHDHPHAVRILARAWLYVIWHCWQERHRLRPRPTQRPPTRLANKTRPQQAA